MRKLLTLGIAAGGLFMAADLASLGGSLAQAQPAGPPISFTEQQARQGRGVYGNCEACHGGDLGGLDGGPPLIGDNFARWFDQPPVDLFTFIHESMPADAPGTLTPGDAAAVMTYILQSNGFTPGTEPMPSDPAILATMTYPPHTAPAP
jgi:mono/diheme cytochrome c family protein